MSDSTRPTSIPSKAKIITAAGSAAAVIVAQLAEALVACGAVWLRSTGDLSETNFMLVAGGLIAGPVISLARGGPKVPSSILVAGILPTILLTASKVKALLL